MISEFEFVRNIKRKHDLRRVGDDCAVLPKDGEVDLVVTADLLVEDIDFRLAWTTPEMLGHKALAVSLSDVAAMGAVPKWAMISIGVPTDLWETDFLCGFYAGWHALSSQFGVELIGGDTSRSPDRLVIDSVAAGEVSSGKALVRSGAVSGDLVVVTGTLGGSAGGLQLLEAGGQYGTEAALWEQNLLLTHLKPSPQIALAMSLQRNGMVRSMIDISDGLLSDLEHICSSSSVGARIVAEQIPIHPDLAKVIGSEEDRLELAINGGEDYQLLFTVSIEDFDRLLSTSDERIFTVIGEVTGKVGIVELVRSGKASVVESKGYRHF
ncbi:MAG: thiamine-phosphate kinase [Pyrinomonadaceae bacterium]